MVRTQPKLLTLQGIESKIVSSTHTHNYDDVSGAIISYDLTSSYCAESADKLTQVCLGLATTGRASTDDMQCDLQFAKDRTAKDDNASMD